MKEINGVIREDGDVVWVGSLTLVRYERRGGYWYKVTTTTGS